MCQNVFFYHMQFSVVIKASLIGQSSLSFIAVLHMFEHVLFDYQRHGVVSFITLAIQCSRLRFSDWSVEFKLCYQLAHINLKTCCFIIKDKVGSQVLGSA